MSCINAVIEQIRTRKRDSTTVQAFIFTALENDNARWFAKTLLDYPEIEFCDCCCHAYPDGLINHALACCNGACSKCKRGINGCIEDHESRCLAVNPEMPYQLTMGQFRELTKNVSDKAALVLTLPKDFKMLSDALDVSFDVQVNPADPVVTLTIKRKSSMTNEDIQKLEEQAVNGVVGSEARLQLARDQIQLTVSDANYYQEYLIICEDLVRSRIPAETAKHRLMLLNVRYRLEVGTKTLRETVLGGKLIGRGYLTDHFKPLDDAEEDDDDDDSWTASGVGC